MQPHRRPIYQRVGKILGVTWWQQRQPNSDQNKPHNKSPFRPLGQSKNQITQPERSSSKLSDQDTGSELHAFEVAEDGFKRKSDQVHDFKHNRESQDKVLLVKILQANDRDREEQAKEGSQNSNSGIQGRLPGIMQSVDDGQSAGTDGHFRSNIRSSPEVNYSSEWTQNRGEAKVALSADNPSLARAAKTSGTSGSLPWPFRPASSDVASWRSSAVFNAPGSRSHLGYGGNTITASASQGQGLSVLLHVVNDSAAALTSSQGTTYLQYDPLTGQLTPAVSTTTTTVNGTDSDVVGYLQIDASRPILHSSPSHSTDNDPIFGLVRLDHTSLQKGGSDLSTVIQNGAYLQFNPLAADTQQTNITSQQATVYLQLEPAAQALLNSKSVGQQRVYLQFDPQLSSLVHTNNAGKRQSLVTPFFVTSRQYRY